MRSLVDFVDSASPRASVDMGRVTFEPDEIPVDVPSAFDIEVSYHGTQYRGDAAGIGNPHLVLLVDDVGGRARRPSTVRIWSTTSGSRRVSTSSSSRCSTPIVFACGSGSGGSGRRSRAVPGCARLAAVAHRRGLVGDELVVEVPGGTHTVALGDTVRLGGDVRHVFDVDIDPAEVERSLR